MLESIGGEDVFDDLWGELVFRATPESGQSKLGIGIHGWFVEEAFPRMEKLTGEWVIETWLPLLNEG
jgi:hypothetical protein